MRFFVNHYSSVWFSLFCPSSIFLNGLLLRNRALIKHILRSCKVVSFFMYSRHYYNSQEYSLELRMHFEARQIGEKVVANGRKNTFAGTFCQKMSSSRDISK